MELRNAYSLDVDNVLDLACHQGSLYESFKICKTLPDSSETSFILASFELILNSNAKKAVMLHREGKLLNASVVPPLAKLHLDGNSCGGMGDVFYVTAVIIKELVDSNIDTSKLLNGLTTLITLTSDSGLHHAAEKHISHALKLNPNDASLLFRAALMTPGVFESKKHIAKTRELLLSRIHDLVARRGAAEKPLILKNLDEFVLSPTFYFIYQGYNDEELLSQLHTAYASAFPALAKVEINDKMDNQVYTFQQMQQSAAAPRKIRVGFVSSFFRRHSVCKLFCGFLSHLNSTLFDVVAFSSLQETHEDSYTASLKGTASRGNQKDKTSNSVAHRIEFVTLGKTLIQNRNEVVRREIDVLVSCMFRYLLPTLIRNIRTAQYLTTM